MPKTTIKINRGHEKKSLYVILAFDRPIEKADIKWCGQAFALAVDEAFVQTGNVLEAFGLDPVTPNTPAPSSLQGRATLLRGTILAEHMNIFDRALQRFLAKTGGQYTIELAIGANQRAST